MIGFITTAFRFPPSITTLLRNKMTREIELMMTSSVSQNWEILARECPDADPIVREEWAGQWAVLEGEAEQRERWEEEIDEMRAREQKEEEDYRREQEAIALEIDRRDRAFLNFLDKEEEIEEEEILPLEAETWQRKTLPRGTRLCNCGCCRRVSRLTRSMISGVPKRGKWQKSRRDHAIAA